MQPIGEHDAQRAAAFLHAHLNPRVPVSAWTGIMDPPWGHRGPNRGFQLLDGDDLVGVYAAVYSRPRSEGLESVCNLAAFCVLESHRAHSLRLIRAVLGQRGYAFTDLSPSGSVPALNARMGFEFLDTSTRLTVNLSLPLRSTLRVTEEPEGIAALLRGTDVGIYEDHRRAPAARHIAVSGADGYAYLMYRRVRRKRLALFASPIHVGGDPALLGDAWPQVAARILRHGMPFTLAERRVLGFAPPAPGRELRQPRPRMFRGNGLAGSDVDYLYSELALLDW